MRHPPPQAIEVFGHYRVFVACRIAVPSHRAVLRVIMLSLGMYAWTYSHFKHCESGCLMHLDERLLLVLCFARTYAWPLLRSIYSARSKPAWSREV